MHKFFNREYCVAVCDSDNITTDFHDKTFKIIRNGFGYWAADPFPVEVDGELYIFAEIFEYKKVKGAIGYTKKTKEGFTKWKIVIDESYHLSFPNIFKIENTFYICPEAHESGSVYLYKCIDFPEKWVKDRILFRSDNAVDTVFFELGKEFYGLTCMWEGLDRHSLSIFKVGNENCEFSDIKLNVLPYYCSRPAGKIFYDKMLDTKFVVAQICKPIYGTGLIFKKYSLDWPCYSETEYKKIFPKDVRCNSTRKFDGIHTFNVTENYIVIDLAWSRINVYEKICRFIRKINRAKERNSRK